MEKLLVTGASGFLGSRVAQYYKERYEVITPSHSDMDITDEQSVKNYFNLTRPDVVIHCAAMSDVGACESDPEKSWKVNVIGTENIVKCAKEIYAKCICCSSDQVYCTVKTIDPNREEIPVQPTNVYGKEKAYAEKSCLDIYAESIHLRLSWMYDVDDEKRMDFIKQLNACHTKMREVRFSGMDHRGITDVWEVVRNMELLFKVPGGIYNFGSPNDKSTYETVKEIFKGKAYDVNLVQEIENANFRNLSMSQEKVNRYGICFSGTVEAVVKKW
jgi:dTDP-4-dehydrorhamnose reductase